MNYKKVIADSWAYTQQNKKLIRWFGFAPALFTTTYGVGYIAYQFFSFKESYIFNAEDHSFFSDVIGFIWTFMAQHLSWTAPIIVIAVIFGLIFILFPTLAKASAIQMIARNRNGQKASVGTGLKFGIMSYLKLFEYHLLIKTFAFFSILGEMSFVIRNIGPSAFAFLLPVFLVFIVISFLLTLLFTYSDFFIVIDDVGIFESMKKSGKLVITHWKHTFLITILMILIGVRIVIQAIMVFLIPALIILISGYIATITLPLTGLIIGGSVGLIALVVAAYLNGIVDIFAYSVWTFTFLDLTAQEEVSAREVFADEIEEVQSHHYSGHKNLNGGRVAPESKQNENHEEDVD